MLSASATRRRRKTCCDGDARAPVLDAWSTDAKDITDILKAIALVKSAPQRSRDIVAGYGEIWSARLLAAFLAQEAPGRGGKWVDAREVVIVNETELGPTVLWEESQARFDKAIASDFRGIAVITGFIASDREGLQTTLGRNGSDFSAAIFAALSEASELTIWSDVDGVMSADPSRVPEAQVIDKLTYNEAMELAYFGATVIHPQTMGPAIGKDIPVRIRNSHNPAHPGSLHRTAADDTNTIKGITAIGGMALLNLEGAGMIGVPGTADRMFASLKSAGVSVTLISQASSEHSICIAVPEDVAERARSVVTDAFAEELESGQINSVDITPGQSIVAVVGDGMAGTPGIAATFFGTLGRAGINIRAIAQGSSERNISAVVDCDDVTRALRAAHSGFLPVAQNDVDRPDRAGNGRCRAAATTGETGVSAWRRNSISIFVFGRLRVRSRCCWVTGVSIWRPGRTNSKTVRSRRTSSFRAARQSGPPAACGYHRLHGERENRVEVRRLAGSRHPCHHAEQESVQWFLCRLPGIAGSGRRGQFALLL